MVDIEKALHKFNNFVTHTEKMYTEIKVFYDGYIKRIIDPSAL